MPTRNEGLGLVKQQEAVNAARLEALRRAVDGGINDINQGRFEAVTTTAAITVFLEELGPDRIPEMLRSGRSP